MCDLAARKGPEVIGRLGVRAAIALVSIFALGACDPAAPIGNSSAPAGEAQPAQATRLPIMIRNVAGGPKQRAFLVRPDHDVPLDQLAAAVRETGYRCATVNAFNQLEQNAEVLPIYRIDCGRRAYQVTMIDGHSHIKHWTGNVFGQ